MKDILRQMDEAIQELVPAELKALGWRYFDMPVKLSDAMWDEFLTILGPDNFKLLIMSSGPGWKRGQFLLSPAAYENLRQYGINPEGTTS